MMKKIILGAVFVLTAAWYLLLITGGVLIVMWLWQQVIG